MKTITNKSQLTLIFNLLRNYYTIIDVGARIDGDDRKVTNIIRTNEFRF